MVQILDKRTTAAQPPAYSIGDWVYYIDGDVSYLCVICQTSSGIGQLICITNGCANRIGESFKIHENGGNHNKLSQPTINNITNDGEIKLEKVNVYIQVTNHTP